MHDGLYDYYFINAFIYSFNILSKKKNDDKETPSAVPKPFYINIF